MLLSNNFLPIAIILLIIQNIMLLAISIVANIVGLFAVAIGLFFVEDQISNSDGRPIVNLPKWLWIFGNDADGVNGDKRLWWDKNCDNLVLFGLLPMLRTKGFNINKLTSNDYISRWWWAAIRNPSNNLRFVDWLSCPIQQCQMFYFGNKEVSDKLGKEGWQIVIGKHDLSWKWWIGWYWVHRYTNSTNGLRVRMGYKIKPEYNIDQTKGYAISIILNKDLT